ncbi:MAG: hypothetical protein P8Z72_09960 [Gammaproteobacteria bacterium]
MRKLLVLGLLLIAGVAQAATTALGEQTWFQRDSAGKPIISFYFYWSNQCPHCAAALPVVHDLAVLHPDLSLHSYQLVGQPDNVARYQVMASALGEEARSVPAFFLCNTMLTGFDPQVTPRQLESLFDRCKQHITTHTSLAGFNGMQPSPIVMHLPYFGAIEAGVSSLPLITVLIAGVDAFNPCAFFVLLFLLSLMLHSGGRRRMLLVGGIFVFASGLLYFLFMSAWLNLFRAIGHLDAITLAAGLVALLVGMINIKDYFWFRRGLSLTISEQAKPRLFQRMRRLLQARSLPTMLLAASGLALFANLYEFLCTAGFPMVYTRILTLSHLSDVEYYAYLLLYNLVYVIPLFLIVIVFVISMGVRKLQQGEGRVLKLLSGTMMLGLGLVLLLVPDLLQNVFATLLLLLLAIVVTFTLNTAYNMFQKRKLS